MIFRIVLPTFLFLWIFASGLNPAETPRVVRAVRVDEPMTIDGVLDESVWRTPGYTGFTQREPQDGRPATEKTEVWVGYDRKALFVAARLYDSEPERIVSRLGRRDEAVESDWFAVAIDPYFDKRSGYRFSITPAGSIADLSLFNDEWDDPTWDGIWESATRIDERGWTVEIRIPFHQLRFKQQAHATWGINFHRIIMRKNEQDWFAHVPREDSGYVSRFARLEGLNGIHPGRAAEFLPYAAAQAEYSPVDEGDPFDTRHAYSLLAGVDFKIGLKSNLTLDATVNPDFGQVEVDPAVINLTAFETYYDEKRPFFIEGANTFRFGQGGATDFWSFDWGNPAFFYSRRIGRSPQGDVVEDYDYADYPSWTTILGAAKITGQLGKGWNVGFLNGVTGRETGRVAVGDDQLSGQVEPLTNYTVLRAQKEFNEGRQGLGFITTSVLRDLHTPNLEDLLGDKAFSLAVDGWTFLDRDRVWALAGWVGATRVSGSREAILEKQESSLHYFQRPDADHVELDPQATSISGWATRFTLNKQKGNVMLNAAVGAISPGFDSTDLGFQWAGDVINGHLGAGYRWLNPGKVFRDAWVIGAVSRNLDFGGNVIDAGYHLIAEGRLLNYWGGEWFMAYFPEALSNTATRGGPLMIKPEWFFTRFELRTDGRKTVVAEFDGDYWSRDYGSEGWEASVMLHIKPASNVTISFGPEYETERNAAQWVENVEDDTMAATFGTRHVFANLMQRTVSATLRLNWTFTPKLSLQAYLQPFIAVGRFSGLKELARPSSYDFNVYGTQGSTISYDDGDAVYTIDPDGPGPADAFVLDNPDFNFKSLRGTVVLRWEYRPGSTLYLVWTQDRVDEENPGDFRFGRDFGDMISASGTNVFMLKLTYRFQL